MKYSKNIDIIKQRKSDYLLLQIIKFYNSTPKGNPSISFSYILQFYFHNTVQNEIW